MMLPIRVHSPSASQIISGRQDYSKSSTQPAQTHQQQHEQYQQQHPHPQQLDGGIPTQGLPAVQQPAIPQGWMQFQQYEDIIPVASTNGLNNAPFLDPNESMVGISKKYSCTHCSSSFTRNSSLKRHINSKHLLLKYKCDICPNYYNKRKDYLQRHAFIKHGMTKEEFLQRNYKQEYVYEDGPNHHQIYDTNTKRHKSQAARKEKKSSTSSFEGDSKANPAVKQENNMPFVSAQEHDLSHLPGLPQDQYYAVQSIQPIPPPVSNSQMARSAEHYPGTNGALLPPQQTYVQSPTGVIFPTFQQQPQQPFQQPTMVQIYEQPKLNKSSFSRNAHDTFNASAGSVPTNLSMPAQRSISLSAVPLMNGTHIGTAIPSSSYNPPPPLHAPPQSHQHPHNLSSSLPNNSSTRSSTAGQPPFLVNAPVDYKNNTGTTSSTAVQGPGMSLSQSQSAPQINSQPQHYSNFMDRSFPQNP